jgi:hypothetical protein
LVFYLTKWFFSLRLLENLFCLLKFSKMQSVFIPSQFLTIFLVLGKRMDNALQWSMDDPNIVSCRWQIVCNTELG